MQCSVLLLENGTSRVWWTDQIGQAERFILVKDHYLKSKCWLTFQSTLHQPCFITGSEKGRLRDHLNFNYFFRPAERSIHNRNVVWNHCSRIWWMDQMGWLRDHLIKNVLFRPDGRQPFRNDTVLEMALAAFGIRIRIGRLRDHLNYTICYVLVKHHHSESKRDLKWH